MHDLINDLAQWAAKDFCSRIENLQEGKKQWEISENLRHLAFLIDGSNYDNFKESGAFNKMKRVRTFLALSPYSLQPNSFDDLLGKKLSIRKCSKLEGKLPEHLPSLKSLLIEDCEQWIVSVPRLPEDCTIQIFNCKEVVLSSIKDCSSLSSMVHLLSVISSRMFLAEGFAKGFSKVEKLDIVAYDEPTSFLKCGNRSLQDFRSLEFSHKFWPCLYGSIEEMLEQKELPGRCQYLLLEGCQDPVKLEQALQSLSFLRGITIRKSKETKIFREADDGLPQSLKQLEIEDCPLLEERCKEGGLYWPNISHLSKDLPGYDTSESED
ncbi:hypothetical protein Q3G72_030546 [Acer saccharum]|nr:hypothetical protein Q3G72_030546 [Acer saccharum]